MFILVDKSDIKDRKTMLKIGVYEEGKQIAVVSTSFLGPFN
jgi:hypothetical protein